MSIASEIQRLQSAKADLKTAIEAKGVTVPSNATIDTYDDYIAQITGGLSRVTSGTPYCNGQDLYIDVTTDISIDGGTSWVESGVTNVLIETGSSQCSRVPKGYTEVEYVQNTTQAYINTNLQIYSSTTNSFEVEAKLIAAKHDSQMYQNIFTCMSEAGEPYQGFVYRYQSNNVVGTSLPSGENTFTVVNNSDSTQTVTVTSSSSQRTYSHTYPLALFCGLNSSRAPFRFTNSKFYYCTIKMNGSLIMELIPCTRDSDSIAGMYDIVNNTFYSSANSGYELVAGDRV